MAVVLPSSSQSSTRGELVQKLRDRGFDHLEDPVLEDIVDEAVSEVHNEGDWPYKEATRTGALPLVVEDLSQVRGVALASVEAGALAVVERNWLIERFGALDVAGEPRFAYVESGTIVRSYPASLRAVELRYMSTSAWESGGEVAASDGDRPLVPRRFQSAVLFKGLELCYGEDAQVEADGWAARYDRRIEQMRFQLLSVNRGEPTVVRTGYNDY